MNVVQGSVKNIQKVKTEQECAHPENIQPPPPHRKDWNFLRVGGTVRPKNFKEMCEALLEFPVGWRYGYFSALRSVKGRFNPISTATQLLCDKLTENFACIS